MFEDIQIGERTFDLLDVPDAVIHRIATVAVISVQGGVGVAVMIVTVKEFQPEGPVEVLEDLKLFGIENVEELVRVKQLLHKIIKFKMSVEDK